MRRPARRLGPWVAAVAGLILAACGEEPRPPSLTGFTPPDPAVSAGEALDLRVEYEANDYALDAFEWTAEAGAIEGNGKAAITYRAPDAAGAYKLTVTASVAGGDLAPLSLDTLVEVRPAPAPAVSEAPPGGRSPGQRAAEAARAALQATTSEATEAGEGVTEAAETAVESATGTVVAAPPATEAAPTATADGVARILDRSRVIAVIAEDLPPFSFEQDGERVGFEIDLVREFARRWVGNADAVTLLPVTPDERIATLRRGDADLIAAALTKTAEREQLIDFSQTYFKDGQRLLVAEDADIAGPCDLAGKKVAVLAGTTSLDNMAAEAASCGFASDDAVVFERRDQAVAALLEGEVAAFTSDGIGLERLAAGQPLKVVGNHFSEEPYGIGVRRGDDRLRRLVDLTLQKMAEDGTFAAIYRKWFGDDLSPYPL